MKNLMVFLILALPFFTSNALALPALVALIRHAEKPENGNELNDRGWQRAGVLPVLFKNRDELNVDGPPAALYAMDPKDDAGSVRSIQTLQYLSHSLNLPIRSAFKKKQHAQMVREILNNPDLNGKLVVICWEHKYLEEIARDFGISNVPHWDKNTYDRIWLISNLQTPQLKMQNLPQRALPDDSAN